MIYKLPSTSFLRKKYRLIFSLPALMVLLVSSFSAADAQLKADFTADTMGGCTPLVVHFTDQSTGSPTSWKWDFDDGRGSATIQNPTRTFSKSGTYTITLTVEDSNGHESDTIKKAYITVYDKPQVSFTSTPTTGCFPLNVHFTDQSKAGSGKIQSWLWDFRDGDTSTDADPVHTYKKAGTFNVSLVVTNSKGCKDSHTQNKPINTKGLNARFTADQVFSCSAPMNVQFNAYSSNTQQVTYHWDFGDGKISTGAAPAHRYTQSGDYTVTLIATASVGCPDTVVRRDFIHVASFHSNFTIPEGCIGTPLTFENTSDPAPNSAVWHFDDGAVVHGMNAIHQFNKAGKYNITLINTYDGGCRDSITQSLTIAPPPEADFKMDTILSCSKPTKATFTNRSKNAVSYLWDFGDGFTSTETNPTHSYTKSGRNTIKLIAKNKGGCISPAQKTMNIRVLKPEIFNISAPKRSGCVPLTVHFQSLVNNAGANAQYSWDFGDKHAGTSSAPSHKYTDTGVYDVSLKIKTSEGCMDSLLQKKFIQVVDTPVLSFTASDKVACLNTPVQLTNKSIPADANWTWEFPDDGYTTEYTQNPLHQFSHLGKQDVTLTADYKGCSKSKTITGLITIEPPEAIFSVSQSCKNPYIATFTNESLQATKWHWDFGDGKQSDLQNPPPHKYADTGTYSVTLRTQNGNCTSDTGITIHIIDLHPILKLSADTVCHGTAVTFSLKNKTNARWIQTYEWILGNGGSYTTTYPNISFHYTQTGTYHAQLITTDLNGCRDTSAIVPITVEGPLANFQLSPPQSCTGNKVTFTKDQIG